MRNHVVGRSNVAFITSLTGFRIKFYDILQVYIILYVMEYTQIYR